MSASLYNIRSDGLVCCWKECVGRVLLSLFGRAVQKKESERVSSMRSIQPPSQVHRQPNVRNDSRCVFESIRFAGDKLWARGLQRKARRFIHAENLSSGSRPLSRGFEQKGSAAQNVLCLFVTDYLFTPHRRTRTWVSLWKNDREGAIDGEKKEKRRKKSCTHSLEAQRSSPERC